MSWDRSLFLFSVCIPHTHTPYSLVWLENTQQATFESTNKQIFFRTGKITARANHKYKQVRLFMDLEKDLLAIQGNIFVCLFVCLFSMAFGQTNQLLFFFSVGILGRKEIISDELVGLYYWRIKLCLCVHHGTNPGNCLTRFRGKKDRLNIDPDDGGTGLGQMAR